MARSIGSLLLFLFIAVISLRPEPALKADSSRAIIQWSSLHQRDDAQNQTISADGSQPIAIAHHQNSLWVNIQRGYNPNTKHLNYMRLTGPDAFVLRRFPFAEPPTNRFNIAPPFNEQEVLLFQIDSCNRLWTLFMYFNIFTLHVYNLADMRLLHMEKLSDKHFTQPQMYIDCLECDETYAYIGDHRFASVVVFSLTGRVRWDVELCTENDLAECADIVYDIRALDKRQRRLYFTAERSESLSMYWVSTTRLVPHAKITRNDVRFAYVVPKKEFTELLDGQMVAVQGSVIDVVPGSGTLLLWQNGLVSPQRCEAKEQPYLYLSVDADNDELWSLRLYAAGAGNDYIIERENVSEITNGQVVIRQRTNSGLRVTAVLEVILFAMLVFVPILAIRTYN